LVQTITNDMHAMQKLPSLRLTPTASMINNNHKTTMTR